VNPGSPVEVRHRHTPSFRALIALALGAGLVLTVAALLPPRTLSLDIAGPSSAWRLRGIGPPSEHHGLRGRWTYGEGTVRVPAPPIASTVTLRVSAPPERLPDAIEIVQDGVPAARARLTADEQEVVFPLRPAPSGEAILWIRSLVTPGPRPMGIFISRVDVSTGGWAALARSTSTAAWLAIASVALGIGAWGFLDWSRPRRAALVTVSALAWLTTTLVWFRFEVTPSAPLLALLSWGGLVVAWAIDRPAADPPSREASAPRSRRPAWLFAAVALVLVGCLFREYVTRGWVLSQSHIVFEYAPWSEHAPADYVARPRSPVGDIPMLVYPFLSVARERLRAGSLPLWTSAIGAGQPFLGTYQSAVFSPFTAVALVMPLPDATVAIAMLRLFIGGVGMFLFLRRLELSAGASMVGGIAWLLNPYGLVLLEYPAGGVPPWTPWMLLCAHGAATTGGRWVAALAAVVAAALFAGHPHTAGFAALFAAAYGAVVACAQAARLRALTRVAFAVALGGMLASIQILPFLEYLNLSRGAGLRGGHALNPYHAPVSTLIAAFVPNFWGHHSAGNFAGPTNYLEQASYPGAVVWLLALVAVFAGRRQLRVWFFAVAAALALLTFYGAPGVLHLISSVPLLASASLPRVAVVATAALVVLAAHGVDAAVTRTDVRVRSLTIVSIAATAALVAAMMAAFRIYTPDLVRHDLLAWSATWVGWAVLLLTATALAVLGGAARLASRGAIVAVLLSLIVSDQMAFGRNFRDMTPRDQVFPSAPEIDRIRQDPGLVRTIGIATHLFPNSAMVYHLQDLRTYDGLGVSHYAELLDVVLPYVPGHQFHEADRLRGGPLLDLLNVKYVIAPGTVDPPPNFVPVTGVPAILFENRQVMPRAFLVDAAVVLQGNAARRTLRDARVDPRRTVVLDTGLPPDEQPMPAGDPSAVGSARVLRYEEERVEIDTDAPGARLLVLTDTDYPGWRAFVDGREVAVRRANFAFRAVAVPAGTHRVVFVYAPDSVRRGAQLSGLALVIVLGVVVMGGRWPVRRQTP
jgi:hypothetical protein